MEWTFLLAGLAALMMGISKGGIKGLSPLIVTLFAYALGAKASTGVILPLLVVGDVMAVIYFKRYTRWKYLLRLLPWMLLGVLVAVWIGKNMSEDIFKQWMAVIILISVGMMWWMERIKSQSLIENKAFGISIGFTAGFTTMIGNLAGAFSNLYFLAIRLPKNEFIGTAAWLFLIVNTFKIPFHIFSWKTISLESIQLDAYLLPFVLVGFFIGRKLLGYMNEAFFRRFILVVTAIGALIILLK